MVYSFVLEDTVGVLAHFLQQPGSFGSIHLPRRERLGSCGVGLWLSEAALCEA